MDKIKGLSQIMSLLKSQDGHAYSKVNLEWTKYRRVIKLDWLYVRIYFTSPKKVPYTEGRLDRCHIDIPRELSEIHT